MTTQEHWKRILTQANRWVNGNFPQFSHQLFPYYSLDVYVEGLQVEFIDGLSIDGREIDAMLDGSSLDVLKVNPGATLPKSEGERTAIAVHEITEGYGVRSHLYFPYGFNAVRVEHYYAEFIEAHYRRTNNLPRCPLELNPNDFELMGKMDEFYRKFPVGRSYIGTMLYVTLIKNPDSSVDENLRSKVLEKYRFG